MIEGARKIGMWNAFFMMLLSIVLYTHVLLIPALVIKSGRDGWLSILIATAIMLPWVWMFSIISKQLKGTSLPLWLEARFGVVLRYIFSLPLAACLLLMTVVTFRDTISWSTATYLPYTPPIALALFFAVLCYWLCSLGIRNVAFSAGILGPLVVLCGLFIMSANMPKKHYPMLLPVLEHGMAPVWQSVWDVLGGWMEIFVVLLLQSYLAPRVKLNLWTLSIFLLVIMGITIGPFMGAVAAFGPQEAMGQRYPAFEQWRIVQIGKYVEHLDFLSIYQWLSGAFIRVSLLGFLILDLFTIRTRRGKRVFLAVLFLLLAASTLAPLSDVAFFNLVITYYTPCILIIFGGSAVILFALALLQGRREQLS